MSVSDVTLRRKSCNKDGAPIKTTPSLAELETSGLEELAGLAPELALSEVVPMMNRLVANPAFLDNYILPLIDDARSTEGWYVAHRYELGEGSCSLEVFVWPPGSGTAIHDHSSWGAYRCVLGSLMEERYKRLDDGTQPEYARLKKVWKLWWGPKDGVSTVLPYDGGIHRVGNPGQGTAISVHLYGPRIGEIDGRDYDPARDFVCDRVAA